MVKDIQDSFRYYYWNKESELQSGIKREGAVGYTDYEIYGEERGRRYREVHAGISGRNQVYRARPDIAARRPHAATTTGDRHEARFHPSGSER